jgi:hypothetical protein
VAVLDRLVQQEALAAQDLLAAAAQVGQEPLVVEPPIMSQDL